VTATGDATAAFMAAVTAPDPRAKLKVDLLMAGMDDKTAEVVRGVIEDRSYSVARVEAGFKALGYTISASSIDTWRRRNGI